MASGPAIIASAKFLAYFIKPCNNEVELVLCKVFEVYHHRYYESTILRLATSFRSVLLLGARQVGKTTLLKHLYPELRYFLFDPTQDIHNVRKDPDLFLRQSTPPLILDEVQYVPELLSALKRHIDQRGTPGQYFLTGSQNFSSLKQISESLAGRVAILELWPLTLLEKNNISFEQSWLQKYLSNPAAIANVPIKMTSDMLTHTIWRGGFPELINLSDEDVGYFFKSYMQTYVERDIRTISQIKDMQAFSNFFSLQGALTAQEVNRAHLGREVDISSATAQEWSNLLKAGYQWIEIPAFSGNLVKRLAHKAKGYIVDTGLACYLMRLNTSQSLLGHPSFGALFETYCVNEIYRWLKASGKSFQLYHWRSAGGAEVDLIIDMDGILYPIEMKAKSHPNRRDVQGILKFSQAYSHLKIAPGLVIHAGVDVYKTHENVTALPWNSYLA